MARRKRRKGIDRPAALARLASSALRKNAAAIRKAKVPIETEPPAAYRP